MGAVAILQTFPHARAETVQHKAVQRAEGRAEFSPLRRADLAAATGTSSRR